MQTSFKFIAAVAMLLFGAMQSDAQVGKPHKRNLTVKEWNVDAGSTAKIMDHLTVYDNLGRKIEEAEYDRYGVKRTITLPVKNPNRELDVEEFS